MTAGCTGINKIVRGGHTELEMTRDREYGKDARQQREERRQAAKQFQPVNDGKQMGENDTDAEKQPFILRPGGEPGRKPGQEDDRLPNGLHLQRVDKKAGRRHDVGRQRDIGVLGRADANQTGSAEDGERT
jgi:hypothetical protein